MSRALYLSIVSNQTKSMFDRQFSIIFHDIMTDFGLFHLVNSAELAVHDDKSIRQGGMIGCKEITSFESLFDVRERVLSDMKSEKKIYQNILKTF